MSLLFALRIFQTLFWFLIWWRWTSKCWLGRLQFSCILFTFFESSKTVLINMVATMMMSAKLATLGLLKIMVFWNKGHDVIISVMTSPTKFYHLNYIVDVVMWPKFSNCNISMKEVIITSIFLRGALGSSSVIWDCTRNGLEILHMAKRVKLKAFWQIFRYIWKDLQRCNKNKI